MNANAFQNTRAYTTITFYNTANENLLSDSMKTALENATQVINLNYIATPYIQQNTIVSNIILPNFYSKSEKIKTQKKIRRYIDKI